MQCSVLFFFKAHILIRNAAFRKNGKNSNTKKNTESSEMTFGEYIWQTGMMLNGGWIYMLLNCIRF